MHLEIGCPICHTRTARDLHGHSCRLQCPEPSCQATFQYLGHCHLFLDIYGQAAELQEKGYRAAALILAFTSFELYLEWFLVRKLQHDGRSYREIAGLLRRAWQAERRAGPVFRAVFGIALPEAVRLGGGDGARVAALMRLRKRRNQVVHRGADVSPDECEAALSLIYDVYSALVRHAAAAGLLTQPAARP